MLIYYIMGFFNNLFIHPKKVCMTYYQHFCFSMNVSKKLFIGSVKSFIHALFPDVFITSTTDLLLILQEEMKQVGCRNSCE